jgi:Flp pilus assembly protein TadB
MTHVSYVQLALFALAFGGLQVWWISSTLRGRRLARPMNEQEFKRSLERIWANDQQRRYAAQDWPSPGTEPGSSAR